MENNEKNYELLIKEKSNNEELKSLVSNQVNANQIGIYTEMDVQDKSIFPIQKKQENSYQNFLKKRAISLIFWISVIISFIFGIYSIINVSLIIENSDTITEVKIITFPLEYTKDIFQKKPINDIFLINKNESCNNSSSKVLFEWTGAKSGCYCNDSNVPLKPYICPTKNENCRNIEFQSPEKLDIIFNKKLCVNLLANDMFIYNINCQEKKCSSGLCVANNTKCPISFIRLIHAKTDKNNNENIIVISEKPFIGFAIRREKNERVLIDLKVSLTNLPCYSSSHQSKRNKSKSYELLLNNKKYCDEIPIDNNNNFIIDTINELDFYLQNNLEKKIKKLPLYENFTKENAIFYGQYRPEIKQEKKKNLNCYINLQEKDFPNITLLVNNYRDAIVIGGRIITIFLIILIIYSIFSIGLRIKSFNHWCLPIFKTDKGNIFSFIPYIILAIIVVILFSILEHYLISLFNLKELSKKFNNFSKNNCFTDDYIMKIFKLDNILMENVKMAGDKIDLALSLSVFYLVLVIVFLSLSCLIYFKNRSAS